MAEQNVWLDQNVSFVVGILASIAASVLVLGAHRLWKYFRIVKFYPVAGFGDLSSGQECANLDTDRPAEQIEKVFFLLRALEHELVQISLASLRERRMAQWTVTTGILASLPFIVVVPDNFFTIGAYLLLIALTSHQLCLRSDSYFRLHMLLWPFAPLLWLISLFRGPNTLGQSRHPGRQGIVHFCLWHLLLAIPSSRSAKAVLGRKQESLIHLKHIVRLLELLRKDDEVRQEVIRFLVKIKSVIEIIEHTWPESCSMLETVDIVELHQVTEYTNPQGEGGIEDDHLG